MIAGFTCCSLMTGTSKWIASRDITCGPALRTADAS
jgi:hypothetical protein